MKKERLQHILKVGLWAFTICAAAAAVLAVIQGHYALAVWPILAALFDWQATTFQDLAEDAIEYGDAMMLENMELSSKLCDAEIKIVELQEEINKLKA